MRLGASIIGVTAVVPATFRTVADSAAIVGDAAADRIMRSTGILQCPIASPSTTAADLALEAARRLLERTGTAPSDVDGVVFVTQTPDYPLPSSACILQHRLGLPTSSVAFDVNLGCSGFPYGLLIARGMIATQVASRLLVLAADTLSREVDADDSSMLMAFGDAGVAALVEAGERDDFLAADVGTDGNAYRRMIIAVGRQRFRTKDAFDANRPEELAAIERPESLHLEGPPVLSFAMRQVPGMVERLLDRAGMNYDAVDYYCMSQGNRFVHEHLVDRIGVPLLRCPLSVDRYGNTSVASPALTACDAVAEADRSRELTVAFLGYGSGLSRAGVLVRLRPGTLGSVERIE